MIILPLICFLFLLLFFRCRSGSGTSLLYAALALGVLAAGGAELLSAVSLLSAGGAALFWACAACGALAALFARAGRDGIAGSAARLLQTDALHGRGAAAMAIGICVVAAIAAVIAAAAAPNNWDSMTYHLARAAHWQQQGSVDFYASNILRQIYFPPFAEQAILHSVLLAGSDRFAACVQLTALAGCCAGAALIAKELGADRRAQVFAAIFAATVPMAVLQSTSTQNDLVVGLWLACYALFMIRLSRGAGWAVACAAGASLGLALMTKGTAWIFAPCIFLGTILLPRVDSLKANAMARAGGRPRQTVLIITSLAIGALMAMPHALRNQALFHSPAGPGRAEQGVFYVGNEKMTPAILAANLVRNIGLHLGTPSKKINRLLERGIYGLLGSEAENPASTWIDSHLRVRPGLHEDVAGNPLHALAIAAALCLLFFKRIRQRPLLLVYAAVPAAAFLLFCGLLKWQPFHSRLQLPLFLLAAPFVAAIAGQLAARRALAGIAALLFLAALPWLCCNASRPLFGSRSVAVVPREAQYFANRPALYAGYAAIADTLAARNIGSAGLAFEEDDWEYPFRVMLRHRTKNMPRIEHVLVRNSSSVLVKPDFIPSVIITTRDLQTAQIGSVSYRRGFSVEGIHLLFPKPEVRSKIE